MASEPIGPGFAQYSPPSDNGIREMHLFDFSDSQIPAGGEGFMDTNDNLYLFETEYLNSESLGPLTLSPFDQSTDSAMRDVTDIEFSNRVTEIYEDSDDDNYPEKHALTPQHIAVIDFAGPVGSVTEIDEDSDDDNYPDKHALTAKLTAVTDLTEPFRYALLPEDILNGELMRLDLSEPVLKCPEPYSFNPAFQPGPVPEPRWFNGVDVGADFVADLPMPHQGEANPYTNVQYATHEPYNSAVDQALQPFMSEDAQFGQHQHADSLSQQQQQQQQISPSSVDQFPFPQGNTNVAHPPLLIQNFNFITANSVTINALPSRQDQAQ